ncbi:MAG: HDIG domain-containing metalloprotein [Chloroflexota bacterium]
MNTHGDTHRTNTPAPLGRALVLGLALVVILGALFWWDFPPKQYAFQPGDVSHVRLSAPRQIIFDSASKTKEAQDKATAAIADVYAPPDVQIGRQQLARAQSVLNYLDSLRHDPHTTVAQKQELSAQIPELSISAAAFSATLNTDDARWALVARESLAALEQVMRTEIRPEQVSDARRVLPRFVSRELSTDETMLAGELVKGFVVANSLPNPRQTAALRDEARRAVSSVRVTIRQDETVLREGEVISPATIEALEALGLLQTQRDWRAVAGQWLLGAVLAAVIALSFAAQPPRVWRPWRRIGLVLIVVGATVFAAKVLVPTRAIEPYLLPLPAVSMTFALIFGAPIGVIVSACLALVIGVLADGNRELEMVAYAFVGSAVAAISVHRVERLNSFAWAGALIAVANVSIVAIFWLLAPPTTDMLELLVRTGAALLNATFSVSFALAGYSLTAHYLDIITPLQLLELSRPTHPLLRQMLLKAPGTYHHTLLLSNMAERAAEAIDADPLLARVAAYYHDIGKTVQPYFFIENQLDRANPHDELNDPYESARIVIQHVADGLRLARQFRLPRQVADVIAQHHGTMLVAYFFHHAKLQSPTGEADEQFFRYPGPRPQSREAAIIMLADGAEATVRATHPNTLDELDAVLRKIFRDRLMSGELDESALHLRDLDHIRQAFLEILQGQFHPRIQYPADARDQLPEPPRGVWLEGATIPEKEK